MIETKKMQRTEFPQAIAPKGEAKKIVGAWQLVRADFPPEIADIRGHQPQGMIIYDANGFMAVQLSPGRDLPVPKSYPLPVAETYEAFLGFVSYYGTYTVDWEQKLVTHQRVFMAPPAALSMPFVRRFDLVDDEQITLAPIDSPNARDCRPLLSSWW